MHTATHSIEAENVVKNFQSSTNGLTSSEVQQRLHTYGSNRLPVAQHISIFLHNPLRNPLLLFGTLAAQALHIAAMYTPGLREILDLTPVSLTQWLNTFFPALTLLLAAELYKWLRANKNRISLRE